MKIIQVYLSSFGPHKKMDVAFRDGINKICGPNGCGKSTLLSAIIYAFTGKLNRSLGNKLDYICQLAGEHETSGVTVVFSHGQQTYTLVRNIKPSSATLRRWGVSHELDVTGLAPVSAAIEELFGVSSELLTDYVFVEQWKMFEFIDQSASQRAKAFSELFGAKQADVISKVLSAYKLEDDGTSVDLEAVNKRISNTEHDISELKGKIEEVDRLLPRGWVRTDSEHYKRIANHDKYVDMYAQWQACETKSKELIAKQDECKRLLSTLSIDADALDQAIAPYNLSELETELKMSEVYVKTDKLRQTLQARIDAVKEEIGKHNDAIREAQPLSDQREAGETHIASLRHDIGKLENAIALAAHDKCPTCEQVIVNKYNASYLNSSLTGYRSTLACALSKLDLVNSATATISRCLTSIVIKNEELVRLLRQLSELPTFEHTYTADGLDSVKQKIADYKAIATTKAAKDKEIADLRTTLATDAGALSSMFKQRDELQVTMAPFYVLGDALRDARTKLEYHDKIHKERATSLITLSVMQKSLSDDLVLRKKGLEDKENASQVKTVASHLDKVNEVFKTLPDVASHKCLAAMKVKINQVLDSFDAGFIIKQIEDLRFLIQKKDGTTHYAERLSGGQRILFAMAFRIVVNSEFAGQIGLLCLDEPTAGLDEDNLKCVETAIARLREMSKAHGLQVVMITHDKELDNLFDNVIALPPS